MAKRDGALAERVPGQPVTAARLDKAPPAARLGIQVWPSFFVSSSARQLVGEAVRSTFGDVAAIVLTTTSLRRLLHDTHTTLLVAAERLAGEHQHEETPRI